MATNASSANGGSAAHDGPSRTLSGRAAPRTSRYDPVPFLSGGELRTSRDGTRTWEIHSPYSGELVGRAAVGSAADVRDAIAAAAAAAAVARSQSAGARARVLEHVRAGLEERRDELTGLLAREAGKPVSAARVELDRAVFVFQVAAEEAKRRGGDVLPVDLMPSGEGRWALTLRFPLAPVSAIVPFNFPLLLAVCKLAPAIACGATIVLKPPSQDPLSILALGPLLRDCGYPPGAINIVPCEVEDAGPLVEDSRVRMVSFTGSARVGWMLRGRAPGKRFALELGGNAAVVVEPDADVDEAVRRTVAGGYVYAGQSCISVRRALVHDAVHDAFVERLTAAVAALRTGDPLDEATDVGPLIDESSAVRAEQWIAEAVAGGARVAVGGGRLGSVLEPTLLLGTRPDMRVCREEIFAPLVTVRRYHAFEAALAELNDSDHGLHAGLFTRDIRKAMQAWETVAVGTVVVNDIPGLRMDRLPHGDVKESGPGREAVRHAMDEMTEPRTLVLS